MKPRIRKLVVIVGASALFGGAVAGCGSSSSASTTTTNNSAQAAQSGQAGQAGQPGGGPRSMSAADLKTAATKLGVTTAQLQKAMDAARPTGQPGGGGGGGAGAGGGGGAGNIRTAIVASVAKQLNLSTSKVESALASVMPGPPAGANGGAPPSGAPSQGATSSSGDVTS